MYNFLWIYSKFILEHEFHKNMLALNIYAQTFRGKRLSRFIAKLQKQSPFPESYESDWRSDYHTTLYTLREV